MMFGPIVMGVDLGARDSVVICATRDIGGLRIIEAIHMVEGYEDWSGVRSPGRARRRLRQGHRQNIVQRTRPMPGMMQTADALYGHPDTIARVVRAVSERHRVKLDAAMAEAMGFAKPQRQSDDELLTLDKIRAAQKTIQMLPLSRASLDFESYRKNLDRALWKAFGLSWGGS